MMETNEDETVVWNPTLAWEEVCRRDDVHWMWRPSQYRPALLHTLKNLVRLRI